MAKERRILDRLVPNMFTGRTDWLMDCCTFVDRSVESWFNHPLQQQSLVSVEDRYLFHGVATFDVAGFNGTSSLVHCSSLSLTLLKT